MWSPVYSSDELYHHGILGMKWGVRRYQNPDGTLTAAGRRHLNMGEHKNGLTDDQKNKIKKVAIGAAVIGGTALAAYGAYKYSDFVKNKAYKQLIAKGKAIDVTKLVGNPAKKSEKEKAVQKMYDSINAATTQARKVNLDSEDTEKLIRRTLGMGDKSSVAGNTYNTAADLEKLLANSRRMQTMANESYKAATKSTESFDYAQELLKKNKGKLSGYTMKDLKDLDLY